uniref:Cathepsin B n=1 Tax=Pandalus borealis TaxID=6703 RepID=Q86GF5_PANBO|nr:cathepsin B [Pandalus borealis]
MKVLLLLALVAAASAELDPLSDEFLELLQSKQMTWKAGRNFAKDISKDFLKSLNCVRKNPDIPKLPLKNVTPTKEIPVEFDAREQWPHCPCIDEIRDQGNCGSCWAVSAASVMTDRTCIDTEGLVDFRFSSENVAACCTECGNACYGGDEDTAFTHWVTKGFVSGGRHNSNEGCQPYSVEECEHHIEGPRPPCEGDMPELVCSETCHEEYGKTYEEDLEYGLEAYVLPQDVTQIQEEIMTNGPVTAAFAVYDDFLSYKSGVYQHETGLLDGYHAVRVIGWGEEEGTPYWLVANSWNTDWGDNGLFKILRGSDECEFEGDMAAATYSSK